MRKQTKVIYFRGFASANCVTPGYPDIKTDPWLPGTSRATQTTLPLRKTNKRRRLAKSPTDIREHRARERERRRGEGAERERERERERKGGKSDAAGKFPWRMTLDVTRRDTSYAANNDVVYGVVRATLIADRR